MANTPFTKSIGLISTEYSNPVEAISYKVFNIFEVFRVNKVLKSEDSTQIVLLLVSLYKDDILNSENFNKTLNVSVLNKYIIDSSLNEDSKKTYLSIINVLYDALSQVINQSLDYLGFYLFNIEQELLAEYYPSIFDDVIYRIAKSQGRYTAEFNQPIELTSFINSLVELNTDAKVFNPFAGVASFGINISDNQTYIGQEINQKTWVIGLLRLMAYEALLNANFENSDSIKNWPDESQKFDLIVSTPPFGMRLNRYDIPYDLGQIRTVEEFVITKGLNSLTRKGQMIVVVPRGFLSSGFKSSLEVRKNLIRKDVLEMVISLPTGIFSSTNSATSILVINKNKPKNEAVKFINAEDCYTSQNNNKQLDIQAILSQITAGIDSNIARTTSIHEIKENDFNLNPNVYFKKEIIAPKGVEIKVLKDVLSNIKRNTNHNNPNGRFVQVSDLANDVFDYERSYTEINISTLKKQAVQLNKSALLISKVSLNLKPTHFIKSADEPIYLSLNIEAFDIKDKSVLMPFLIHELYEDYFQEQLNSYVSGSVIASISTKNLLSCKIRVPSLEKQKEIVNESRKRLILEKERELKLLREKFEQQTYEEFASLKHALGKPIPGINTALEYIYEYLKNNQGKKFYLSDVVSKRRQSTLQDKFEVVFNGLKLIQTLLEKGEKGLVVEDYELTGVKLGQIIAEFCNSYSSDKFTIKYFDENKDFEQLEVLANKELVTVLLNDVLSNAHNHAFKTNDLTNNKVDIYLSAEDNYLELFIANNGISFPLNFNKDKFIQKYQKAGESSGAGVGGYDINRIVSYFNGWFDLQTEPVLDYNTLYMFRFPILNIKEDNHE